MQTIHDIKISKDYFESVVLKKKKAELRKMDRDYKVFDYIMMNEIDEQGNYTGRFVNVQISDILVDEKYLQPGFGMLSVDVLNYKAWL